MQIDFYSTEIVIKTKRIHIELIYVLQLGFGFAKSLNDGIWNRYLIQTPFLDIMIITEPKRKENKCK